MRSIVMVLLAATFLAACDQQPASPAPPPPPQQAAFTAPSAAALTAQSAPASIRGAAAPAGAVDLIPAHPVAPPVSVPKLEYQADLKTAQQDTAKHVADLQAVLEHFDGFMEGLDRQYQSDIRTYGRDEAIKRLKQAIAAAGYKAYENTGPEKQKLESGTVCAVGENGERGCLSPDTQGQSAKTADTKPSVFHPNACPLKHPLASPAAAAPAPKTGA